MKVKQKELSTKQRRILDYIHHFWLEKGYPPSVRDIVSGCGFSSTSVADYNLKILERNGCIHRHREISRGIEMPERSATRQKLFIPIIGQISAGKPIPVPDDDTWGDTTFTDTIEVTRDLVRGREGVYALKVKGLSMTDALITDGDIVLMQSVKTVENGEMAAVWLNKEREATLKKFYAESGRIRLQPANSQMKPLFVEPDNAEIQGRVIAIIRQLE
jgi:repressor LexA